MPIDYVAEVSAVESHERLLDLLRLLDTKTAPFGWAPGRGFEHIVLRAFELEGAEIAWPFNVELGEGVVEQIDGVVYYQWLQCLIESKDHFGPINFEPIAKLRTQLARRPSGAFGVVFSRSGFTEPEKQLTRMTNPANILLWTYNELELALKEACMLEALITKVRMAVQYGAPDYNIKDGM